MENKANSPKDVLFALSEIMEKRKTANPDESYVAKLFNEGVDAILKKVISVQPFLTLTPKL